jgi:hypothetical protein
VLFTKNKEKKVSFFDTTKYTIWSPI